jgi:hypothetical protein
MRVAVCLSGQPRKALDTYSNIYEYIIKPNNADVFIHMHYDASNSYIEKTHMDNGSCFCEPNVDKTIIDLYKPKRFLVEAPRNFQKPAFNVPEKRVDAVVRMNAHKNMSRDVAKPHFVKQMTSMFYSIYKSNELKELYANENNIQYDYVIRIRFDLLPEQPIYCSQLDPRFIHYIEMGHPDNLISDWFNIGSNAIMNIYASMYLHMDYLNTFLYFNKDARMPNTCEPSDICGGVCEHLLRDIMYLHRIPKRGLNYPAKLLY